MTNRFFTFLLVIAYTFFVAGAHSFNKIIAVHHVVEETSSIKKENAGHQQNAAAKSETDSKGGHGKTQAAEELPHIHKFHKERVRKIGRHHPKCWFLSKVLLFVCHLLVLYLAYEHLSH